LTAIPLFGLVAGIHQVTPGVVAMSMYEGFFARFYSTTVEYQRADVDWFRRHGGESFSDVLDLCGGSGRLARGITPPGSCAIVADTAPDMLAQAPLDESRKIEFLRADVFHLDLGKAFDLVVCGGLALAMFGSRQRIELLRIATSHLRPGGRVVFDYLPLGEGEVKVTHHMVLPVLDESPGFILAGVQRDPAAKVQRTNLLAEFDRDGGRTVRLVTGHELAVISDGEMTDELDAAGLTALHQHDHLPGTGSSPLTWPLRFVSAGKKEDLS
jgi:SAM-dependent methyltransferase